MCLIYMINIRHAAKGIHGKRHVWFSVYTICREHNVICSVCAAIFLEFCFIQNTIMETEDMPIDPIEAQSIYCAYL